MTASNLHAPFEKISTHCTTYHRCFAFSSKMLMYLNYSGLQALKYGSSLKNLKLVAKNRLQIRWWQRYCCYWYCCCL